MVCWTVNIQLQGQRVNWIRWKSLSSTLYDIWTVDVTRHWVVWNRFKGWVRIWKDTILYCFKVEEAEKVCHGLFILRLPDVSRWQRLQHDVVLATPLYETPFLKALGCEQKENFFVKSATAALFDEFGILICSRNSEIYRFNWQVGSVLALLYCGQR